MLDRRSEMRTWQNRLYNLQREAPSPLPVICNIPLKQKPEQYDNAYHGPLSRQGTEDLLEDCPSGSYLIRDSQRASDSFTLAIRFDNVTKNYKLYYDNNTRMHYVGEKKFESVNQLVADGLIYLYIETRGADVLEKLTEASNYESSPYYKIRYHTINSHPTSQKKLFQHSLNNLNDPNRSSASTLACLGVSNHSRCGLPGQYASIADVDLYRSRSEKQPLHSPSRHPNRPFLVATSDHEGPIRRDQLLPSRPQQATPLKPPIEEDLGTPTSVLEHFPRVPIGSACGGDNQDKTVRSASLPPTQQNNDSAHSTPANDDGVGDVDEEEDESALPIAGGLGSCSNTSSLASSSGVASLTSTHALHNVSLTSTPPLAFDDLGNTNGGSTGSLQLNGSSTTNSPPSEITKQVLKLKQKSATSQLSFLPSPLAEKPHVFRVRTFRRPHWCDFCTHYIWGLVSQGVKCTDCGFQAHKRCSDQVPNDCMPDIRRLKRVFGVDLTSLVRAEKRAIPLVLVKCITELERRGGLKTVGVFRVPGNHEVVEYLRISLDNNCNSVDFSEKYCSDLHTITSLIKSFLRQLPIPLITYEAYPELIDLARDDSISEERKLECLKSILHRLPPAHYQCLEYLMGHLHRVSANQLENMMTPENLAIVLAPTLMSSSYTDPLSCLVGAKFEQAIIELMIVEYHRLFDIDDDRGVVAEQATGDVDNQNEDDEEADDKDSVLFQNSISTGVNNIVSSSVHSTHF